MLFVSLFGSFRALSLFKLKLFKEYWHGENAKFDRFFNVLVLGFIFVSVPFVHMDQPVSTDGLRTDKLFYL